MARKNCDYCGTEYDDQQQRCPLCGSVNEAAGEVAGEDLDEAPLAAAPIRLSAARRPERKRPAYQLPDVEEDADDPPPVRRRKGGGAWEAQREDTIPRWISVLICVVLGLAVVIGATFALYSLGIFSHKPKTEDSALTLPIDPAKPEDGAQTPPVSDPATGPSPDMPVSDPVTGPSPDVPVSAVCTALVLDPTDATLQTRGESFAISVALSPADCTEKQTWTVEDTKVCKVDQDGRVTATNGGTTKVVATCGSVTASCIVRCDFPYDPSLTDTGDTTTAPIGDASLSLTDFTLFSAGETAKITVKNAPAGAQVSWSSSDHAVATVADGTVTAVKSGTATVRATVGGQTLKCVVRCNIKGTTSANDENAEIVGNLSLSSSDVTLGQGESFRLSVSGSSTGHAWSVSDGAVCSVDADGKVSGLSTGTATVSTTVGGQTLKCIVRVK